MFRRVIQSRAGRSLAFTAMAAYAAVGLLGYGLHSVSRCEHAHSAAHDCCGESCHSHAGHSHEASPGHSNSSNTGPSIATGCDDCSICSFLAQAQSSAVALVTIDGSEPLVAAPVLGEPRVVFVFVDAPQARGPPIS